MTVRNLEEIGFEYLGILKPRPAPTAAQIEAIEKRVGAELPADYKAFIVVQNGGAPKKNFVATDDGGYLIECFNYVDGAEEDVYDVASASSYPSESLDEVVVAIAPDGSGDDLILRHSDGQWRIEWWRHDEEGTELIAASFSELLDKLSDEPEY
jgi:hypothetical protein